MSILIKGIPLSGYEISIMKDGERYRARVDGIWCEVEEIPTTDTDPDTISRAKAIDGKICIRRSNGVEIYDDYVVPVEYLEQLPPAQPERIIHCKDCKHWIPYDWMFSEVWQSRNINDYPEDEIGCKYCDMTMKADDFCSRGERRTE